MDTGYIKLYRAISDNPVWTQEPFSSGQAWVDLLLLACHKPRRFKVRGIPVQLEPGQLIASRRFLMHRWHWGSKGKVDRFMADLETDHRIAQSKNNVCTVVTILNWKLYQESQIAKRTAERDTDGPQTDPPKNVKKGKKDTGRFTPPSLEEVQARITEMGYRYVNASVFWNYYESIGWKVGKNKMQDWHRALTGWESREKAKNPRETEEVPFYE